MKKFFCSACGSEVLSEFAVPGDSVQCPSCFSGVVVPDNALDVADLSSSPDGSDALKAYFGIMFSNFIGMFFVGFIFGIVKSVTGKDMLSYLSPISFVFSIFLVLSFVYFFVVKKYGLDIKDYLDIKGISLRDAFLFGIIAVGAGILGIFLEKYFLNAGTPVENFVKNGFNFTLRGKEFSYSYFHVLALLSPFYEELFYRGFMFKAISKNKGIVFSSFIVTFLFVLDHAAQLFRSPVLLGYIGIIGLILILIRVFNKNLTNCILFHFIYNLTVVVLANLALVRTLLFID